MKKRLIACLVLVLVFAFVPTASPAEKNGGVYSLHVGSYVGAEKAAEQVKLLKSKGCDAFSLNPDGKDGRHRVYVGRYAGPEEAAREGAKLEQKKVIRFFAVRKIQAADAPKSPAASRESAAPAAPAPQAPKASHLKDTKIHPQVKIETAAPETSRPGKKSPLYASKLQSAMGDSVTAGLPEPEHFKFQPFEAGASPRPDDGKAGGSLAEDEALYAEAVELYRKGKYSTAIDSFRSYIRQFPGGPRSKSCFYWIAECHSQMQDPKKADEAFGEAVRRWSDYRDIPRETLVSLGFHYFRQGSFDSVIGVFSYTINLYPQDPFRKEMSYLIARSLTEMQQYDSALRAFSAVIEKYPDTKEATESAVIMANIGVKTPGLKIPAHMAGAQHYRDPVATYDKVLEKDLPSLELTERILFQKAYALYQRKQYREAFLASFTQLRRFPNGRCRDAGLQTLKGSTELLVQEDYARGDYLRVADTFLSAYEGAWVKSVDFETGYRIADSLRRVGLYREAHRVADHILMTERDARNRNALLVIAADVNYRERHYDEAERIVTELSRQAAILDREDRQALQRLQGDLYMRKGQYPKAAASYAEIAGAGVADEASLHRSYGIALRFSEACPSALQQFQLAIRQAEKNKAANSQILQDSLAGVGDCYLQTRKYTEAVAAYKQAVETAQGGSQNPWTLYHLGKGYVEMRNLNEANRVFSELKVRTGDDFWNKTIDYTLSEAAWTEKYRKYLPAK
jgi:TolA-binding protein